MLVIWGLYSEGLIFGGGYIRDCAVPSLLIMKVFYNKLFGIEF